MSTYSKQPVNNRQFLATDTEAKLKATVAKVLQMANDEGASQAEVAVTVNSGLATSVRQGEVETIEFTQDQGFGVTVYSGQRKGSASTSDTSDAAIKDTVRAALNIAKYTSEDEFSGLAAAELMATDLPDLELFHPWAPTPEETIAMATDCEQAALGYHDCISMTEGASVSSGEHVRVYGNSHGFIGSYSGSRHGISCSVIAGENELMQRDYWYDSQRHRQHLQPPQEIGVKAAARAVNRLNPKTIATAQYPVLFASEISASLIGHFVSGISGSSLYRKSSFLVNSLGAQIFPDFVDIKEQPRLVGAMGSASFDGDGLATYAKHFVKSGEVSNYILGTYSARKLQMTSTANSGGLHNLKVSSTGQSESQMLQALGTGLLVTELMGQGVNTVTGDYSRGAGGYWVENGEIIHPVQEITIAGNLKSMFADIIAIGDDVVRPANVECGSILIKKMMIAGH